MVIVLLANGFEELEAITPVDVLRRSNVDVRTVSITNEKLITGTHGIQIAADLIASDVPLDSIEMLILPGGMPGVKNLDASPITKIFIDSTLKNNGHLAAICAAPSIFGKHGMLTNIKATCFPGFESEMLNAVLVDTDVVSDGVFTTARDYKSASAFADELIRVCKRKGILPADSEDEAEPEEDAQREDTFAALLEDLKRIGESDPDLDISKLQAILDADNLEFDEDDFELDIDDIDDDFLSLDEILNDPIVSDRLTDKTDGSSILEPEIVGDGLTAEDLEEIRNLAEEIRNYYAEREIGIIITCVERGPRVTRFHLTPIRGTPVKAVVNKSDDLSLTLAVDKIRIEAPIPGKQAIGIEIPNSRAHVVRLTDLLEDAEFKNNKSCTTVAIGKDVAGNNVYHDLASFPHAIIAGSTGMGKSVCMYTILTSIIYKSSPDDVRLILIDPKRVEFRAFKDLPHLLTPIITDINDAVAALKWATEEMERRYQTFEKLHVIRIERYNDMVKASPELGKKLPKIVIAIDELVDLMCHLGDKASTYIMRLAQKARAAGIHVIVGTQRPTMDVLTGYIRSNIPTRFCLCVPSVVDSRTVLDMSGAEKLLNSGDMLFRPNGISHSIRVQGAYVSESEVEQIVSMLNLLYDRHTTDEAVTLAIEKAKADLIEELTRENIISRNRFLDPTFIDAVDIAIKLGAVSTSLLQRKLSIGYGKAAKYIDMMEEIGVAGEPDGQKARKILITAEEWADKLNEIKTETPETADDDEDYFTSKKFMNYLDSFFISDEDEDDEENEDDEESENSTSFFDDETFLAIVDAVLDHGKASTSFIQRKFSIGYGKAAKYIDLLEDLGIVGSPNGTKPREVLITREEWESKIAIQEIDED